MPTPSKHKRVKDMHAAFTSVDEAPPSFPPLPLELVLRIFEFAAQTSHKTCLSISRTSSPSRRIVFAYLFHTVYVPKRRIHLTKLITKLRGVPRVAEAIRNIVFILDKGLNLGDLFSLCPNLESMYIHRLHTEAVLNSLAARPVPRPCPVSLRSLWLGFDDRLCPLPGDAIPSVGRRAEILNTLMGSVTHLIVSYTKWFEEDMSVLQRMFPKITHFAVGQSFRGTWRQELNWLFKAANPDQYFQHWPDLEMLVILVHFELDLDVDIRGVIDEWNIMSQERDGRLFVLDGSETVSYGVPVRSEESVWDKAIRERERSTDNLQIGAEVSEVQ